MRKFNSTFGQKPPKVIKIPNKGSKLLPSRSALHQLTKGTPQQRSTLNFGRLTPIGADIVGGFPDMIELGLGGKDDTGDE